MRPGYSFALVVGVFGTPLVLARGDGSLQAPLSIPAGRPGPVTVNWGDFNKDGKKDLVVANGVHSNVASGSPSILVLLQDPAARQNCKPLSMKVGTSSVYVRAADMTGDGFDDIMVADNARTAWFVRNKGDATFEAPVAIPKTTGARWIAVADFDHDGKLDFASSNFTASNLTIFQGDGAGSFTLKKTFSGAREHVLEAIDYDGDGWVDLMQGSGLPGITPYKNQGDWKWISRPNVANLGCIEYISEVAYYDKSGQYVLIGDFNKDGKGDLAVTCIDDGNAYAGTSIGTGSYKKTLQAAAGGGTEASAIADLNKDGNVDLALVSAGSSNLWVHPGKGDGGFLPPIIFGPTGGTPVLLISQDLDMDGYFDVISAEQTSFTVTVFWGKAGARFLESGFGISGFAGAKSMAVVDLDKDGVPDFLFPRSDQPVVNVYLKPGLAPATKPSRTIAVANKYTILDTADLDGDGLSDLVGADPAGGLMLVALLDLEGTARNQVALAAGIAPSAVKLGQLDEGSTLDVAVPCKGSNHVAIFLGQGGGAFGEARILPTLEKPKAAALGKLDGDGWTDLAVISDNTVAVHFGNGGGDFSEKVQLVQDTSKLYTDAAIGDLNGDSLLDLVVSESKTLSVLVFQGKGSREFVDPPVSMKTSGAPSGLQLTDLNGDGRLDITTSSTHARSVSILLNQGDRGFSTPVGYGVGFPPASYRIADLNQDGALDVVGHSATQAMILLGRPEAVPAPRFRRGDVSADGQIEVTDTILVLNRLFLGGDPLPCEAAADADDDGALSVTDTILILNRLFLGGEPLAPPGTENCGTDPTPDSLGCAANCNG